VSRPHRFRNADSLRPGLDEAIIAATTDPVLAARAAELGTRIRAEQGTGAAADPLESLRDGSRQ
jgi:hypothetical protein